jgi:hypothetical protein
VRNKPMVNAAIVIACLCLAGAVAMFVLLFRIRAGSPPYLRAPNLQAVQSRACPDPSKLVPGTYLADPVRSTDGWMAVTYTVECDPPGGPRQSLNGFAAQDWYSGGCSGGFLGVQPTTPSATGVLTISVSVPIARCDGDFGSPGLIVIPGYVTGSGAVIAQALFASGPSASAPIRASRFLFAVSDKTTICSVRALDAAGAVLAENKLTGSGQNGTAGTCP